MLQYVIKNDISPEEIAELRRSVGWPGMKKELQSPLLKDHFRIGCYDGGKLAGFLAVVSNGVTDAYIQDVMVRPGYQKQGIGSTLMNMAIEKLKEDGIYMVSVLYGEESLRTYYEKLGFHTMLSGQMELYSVEEEPVEPDLPHGQAAPVPEGTMDPGTPLRLSNTPGWEKEAVFYQIYPMGFCGAPFENDGNLQNRISKVKGWVPHLQKLNVGAVYFSPVFESDTHGYDTRDYRQIDCRLGTNEAFREAANALHAAGIRVVIDGVFNHVGRGFWAFQDVLKNREASPYRDWFYINFGGNSGYNDGLWYEGWEGHFELVKLNLQNPAVVDYLLSCVGFWMEEFAIDGLRLDVAYLLDENFLRRLHSFCKEKDPGFFLVGEMIHGDYNRVMNPDMLDSVTNYECYKGLYSAFNSMNMFEIAHSLQRQFGPENWTLYKGKHLLCFADNHDVTRIHSVLQDKQQIFPLYAVLFCMPGIPCLYYGSEWGADGEKKDGDPALRPCFEAPVENGLTEFLGRLARAKRESKALCYGDFKNETLLNKQWVMKRSCPEETVLLAVNAEGAEFTVNCNYSGPATELLTGERTELNGAVSLPPYGVKLYRLG